MALVNLPGKLGFAVLTCFVFGGMTLPLSAAEEKGIRPNILFIMADDLGKEWISCYGAEDIETPHIDALAAGGMKFHNAYSMPQCTPSRVTLLTGKYPFRNGFINHWDVPRWGIGYFDWKQRENTTFARLMKDLGYATCAAGKWQINDFRIEPQAMRKHGFDDWAMWTGAETGVDASQNTAVTLVVLRLHDPNRARTFPDQMGDGRAEIHAVDRASVGIRSCNHEIVVGA